MKEELQGKLVEILTSIQTVAGKAGDFALEQLPTVAQEYVAFGRAWETFWALGVLAAITALTVALWRLVKREGMSGDSAFYGLLFTLFGWVVSIISVKHALLVWFAPKVWLLKEIASLVK